MAGNQETQRKLQEGIAAARSGNRPLGRRLLTEVIDAEPNNELAWIWLASCVSTLADRRYCLEQVLEINPDNDVARKALQQLTEPPATESATITRRAPPPSAAPVGPIADDDQPNPLRFAVLALVAVIVLVLFISPPDFLGGGTDEPTRTPTLIPLSVLQTVSPQNTATATSTPSATPSVTPTPALNFTSRAPTLPATFTPTPTLTVTPTVPTATPVPLDRMQALAISQEAGESAPSLFAYDGDGANEQRIGVNYRDVAFDPTGQRLAFVRDVPVSGDPAGRGSYPQLFIAPVENPQDATQLTDLRARIVASPSWSPDGRELVFVADAEGSEDIWLINADDPSQLRLLVGNEIVSDRDPDWSPVPGSREIVFASALDDLLTTEIYWFTIPAQGSEPELTQLTRADNSSYQPAWSPDGSQIAFISDRRDDDADVYVMSADGAVETLVTINDGNAEDRHPSWTSDGRYIVFSSNRLEDRFQIYLASPDTTVLVRLTRNARQDIQFIYRPDADLMGR